MFIHSIFEKKQTFVSYSIEEIMEMVEHNTIELRETNASHVRKIRKYVVDNFMSNAIYFPPVVATIDEGEISVSEKPKRLKIVDGSSRLRALTDFNQTILKLISSDDEMNQRKGFFLKYRLKEMNIGMQILIGLTEDEADQMYVDLNSKGKKVSLSKRISNDSRNAINVATNQLMKEHEGLKLAGIEVERAAIIRPANKKFLSLSQLRSIVVLFLTGKSVSSHLNVEVYGQREFDEMYHLLALWFDELFTFHAPETIGDYHETILASFAVVMAIAHYAIRDLDELPIQEKQQLMKKRMRHLQSMDWSREQELWQQFDGGFKGKEKYYYLNQSKKSINAIANWLVRERGEA